MKSTISILKRPFWTTFFALVLILGSCTKSDELITPKDGDLKLKTAVTAPCPASEFTLWGGNGTAESNNAGTLKVSNDDTNLYVEFITKAGFEMSEVHVWVGCNLSDVPNVKNVNDNKPEDEEEGPGTPVPGQFPYKLELESANYAKVTIPLSDISCLTGDRCGQSLYVFAHAASSETLWGGDISFLETLDTKRWGWYSLYEICCPPTEEEKCDEETAMGGGVKGSGKAWWYYYTAGSGEQTIWAGQNKDAGSVVVENGFATITLNDGWSLQDVSEPVKIQGYSTPPTSRPAAGLFTTYKGSDLVNIPVGNYSFYVIHLDVKYCYMVPVN